MILLDTHVLVRYLMGDKKLGRRTVASIDKALPDDEVFVSAISFWEVAMLVSRGRIELDSTVELFRSTAIHNGAQEIAIDGAIAVRAAELPDVHGDPADRLLIATAIGRGLTLVTADATLLGWQLRGLRLRDATD